MTDSEAVVAIYRPAFSSGDYDGDFGNCMIDGHHTHLMFPHANDIKSIYVVSCFPFHLKMNKGKFRIGSSAVVGVLLVAPVLLRRPS